MTAVPDHYGSCVEGVETMDAIHACMGSDEAFRGFLAGNVLKYVTRYTRKGDPLGDLAKAKDYLERLIKEVENG